MPRVREYYINDMNQPIQMRTLEAHIRDSIEQVENPVTGFLIHQDEAISYVVDREGNWHAMYESDGSNPPAPRIECQNCFVLRESPSMGIVHTTADRTQSWCQICILRHAQTCATCVNHISTRHRGMITIAGQVVCTDCAAETHTNCGNCGSWIEHRHADEHFDNCESQDDYYGNNVIRDYSFKPRAVFHPRLPAFSFENARIANSDNSRSRVLGADGKAINRSSLLQFGIELEVENSGEEDNATSDVARAFYDKFNTNTLTLKYDSSLYDGFEIVCQPRSLASWREFAPEFGSALLWLRSQGFRSWSNDSCGLHVHASKVAYNGPAHVARYGMLFSRNEEQWVRIAGRRSSYASFSELREGGIMRKARGVCRPGHFDAVSLNSNGQPTTETRIWRPSLAGAGRVLTAVEFGHAAIEYTRLMTSRDVSMGALNWNHFVQYMNEHEYPSAQFVLGGGKFELTESGMPCVS